MLPPSNLTLSLPGRSLGPADLAVIIAEGDPLSEAIGLHYQSARGIPAAHVIRVKLTTGSPTLSAADFATLKAEIDAKLPATAQATLLTWTAPSRVVGPCAMGITSALALGYDAKYCNSNAGGGCTLTANSPYFDSESARPWTDHRMRPSMMLGAATLDDAKALIARGISADASRPTGEGWLMHTSDIDRSMRYDDQRGLPARWAGDLALNFVDNSGGAGGAAGNSISGKRDVLFYFTALAQTPGLSSNSYRPGAIGDSLTSYGGRLPDSLGHTPLSSWLAAGLTASYGTVEEPCNFTAKFSRAGVLIDQYWRGARLIEAYWKSVERPGQGLFVGEPLAQPWPDAPSFAISGGQYVIDTRALRPNASYTLEYRTSATGNWINLATFNTARARQQSLRAPLPPGTATQLRWVGPCPTSNIEQCTLASSA